MLNAAAALTTAEVLGLDCATAAAGLSAFEGVRRRFTSIGTVEGVAVVDDYGHHPTEIRATLHAASNLGYKRVCVVFQPHRYSRLEALKADFADAFAEADYVLLLDVFSAGEMPIPGVTSKALADAIRQAHSTKEVVYVPTRPELMERLHATLHPGDLLITMGAGDVTQIGPEYLEWVQELGAERDVQ